MASVKDFIIGALIALVKVFIIVIQSALSWIPAFQRRKSIRGDIALVTGAASGIGRLQALALARQGCDLVLWDITADGLAKVAEEVKALGQKAYTYTVDVTNRELIYATAEKIKKDAGRVSILVNNAGIATGKKLLDCPDGLIQKTFEVNTISHFWTLKAFLPGMLEANHGHVVTIASNAGLIGVTGLIDYCASKFGAVGIDESLRMELRSLGKDGVHTTCVCPYYINTGMFDGVRTKFPFLLPILEPDFVVQRIMDAILTNQEVLVLPRFSYLGMVLRGLLPTRAFDLMIDLLGANESMEHFKGRAGQAAAAGTSAARK